MSYRYQTLGGGVIQVRHTGRGCHTGNTLGGGVIQVTHWEGVSYSLTTSPTRRLGGWEVGGGGGGGGLGKEVNGGGAVN